MFVQIHMLQSMPPGNLNRDDTGQPKKCIFGRVTRARISSQCLKQNIRKHLKGEYGDALAVRTKDLPHMVEFGLKEINPKMSDDEVNKIKVALAKRFRAEDHVGAEAGEEGNESEEDAKTGTGPDDRANQTGQLVFFPPPFAKEIAKLISDLMKDNGNAYREWIGETKESKKLTKEEKKNLKDSIKKFEDDVSELSRSLTVDIGLFGRMTTSNLVVNVEAACQVAHAVSTHEAVIESDWFTAMDDMKTGPGAAYIGSGEGETFFDSAVYYKYLNLDLDALKKHLSWGDDKAAHAAGVLLEAAARANPTGKQNSFASHGVPELILVEISEQKFPISYANAL